MEKFLFVLGSNWKLSLSELDLVLQSPRFQGRIVDYSKNVAIVEFDKLLNSKNYIDELESLQYILGGTQKIIELYEFIPFYTLKDAFPFKIDNFKDVQEARTKIVDILQDLISQIFPKIKNTKIFFAVSIYPNLFDEKYYKTILTRHFLPFLNQEISNILKSKAAKNAIYFKYPEKYIKNGNLNPIFPHHVIKYELLKQNRAEIVFGVTEEGIYIGRTTMVDDPNFKRKIDEERPNKEFKSSISPKLATIMINYLNLFENRNNKKILDPFVGNGTVSLFALLEDFQVYGTDMDEDKVQNTIRNLQWLQQELNLPILTNLDMKFKNIDIAHLSQYFKANFFDGIVTEPDLGPFYKETPYYTEIIELIEDKLKPLYENLFKEAYIILKKNCRICVVVPSFTVIDDSKDVRFNIFDIARENNFKEIPLITSDRIVNKSNKELQFRKKELFSILDTKKDQIVKRKIYVFEKQ